MSIIRLAIGIPAYGGRVSAEHTRMFLEIGHTLAASEARFQFNNWMYVDTCGIEKARNELLKAAHASGATWLLMLDADTWVVPDGEDGAGFQLLRMISEADRADAAIVGAPVVRRHTVRNRRELAVYRNVVLTSDPPQEQLHPMHDSQLEPVLTEVDALGTAVFAINLSKVGHLSFKFTDDLSEDLDFCRQAKQEGHKIFVDPRVSTAHLSRAYPIVYQGVADEPEVVEKTVPELPEPSRIILP